MLIGKTLPYTTEAQERSRAKKVIITTYNITNILKVLVDVVLDIGGNLSPTGSKLLSMKLLQNTGIQAGDNEQ